MSYKPAITGLLAAYLHHAAMPMALAAPNEAVLHAFAGAADGALAFGGLVADSKGNFYGVTETGGQGGCQEQGDTGCGTVFELSPPKRDGGAWTETQLYSFCTQPVGGVCLDGAVPEAGLLLTTDPQTGLTVLYGTTISGGTSVGFGTVFSLTQPPKSAPPGTPWSEAVLHNFSGGSDGAEPFGPVVADNAGNLYGMTVYGGGGACPSWPGGCGAVYEISPQGGGWSEQVIYAFAGGADGAAPQQGLLATFGQGGGITALYGVTAIGGGGACSAYGSGCGTVFQLTPPGGGGGSWTEVNRLAFAPSQGFYPDATLTADPAGDLFGVNQYGGPAGDNGTVFEIPGALNGGTWTALTLYAFPSGGSGGSSPGGQLVIGGLTASGTPSTLYGTAGRGGLDADCVGAGAGCGTVYALKAPAGKRTVWSETVLHEFSDDPDGAVPFSVMEWRGKLYGTTYNGGGGLCAGPYSGCGTVFEVTP